MGPRVVKAEHTCRKGPLSAQETQPAPRTLTNEVCTPHVSRRFVFVLPPTNIVDKLVLVAVVVASCSPDHEIHRILLVTADVAVAHEEQLQGVLSDLW